MRRLPLSWVSLLVAIGCFGDPPVTDEDATTDASTTATAMDTTAGEASSPSSTADDTAAATATAGTGPTSDETGPTTGSTATCGDGTFEVGEICFADDPTWERDLDGGVFDLAVATLDDDPGDGGVLLEDASGAAIFHSWTWDGVSAAGPTISSAHLLAQAPAFVIARDIDASGGDELIVASVAEVDRWRWEGGVLTFDGPCASLGAMAAIGQVDEDPALEAIWVPAEGAGNLVPWLELDTVGWCDASPDVDPGAGKPGAIAIGPFLGDAPDDLALALDTNVLVTEIESPFALGNGTSLDFGSTPTALAAADLDGDGVRNELVVATSAGVGAVTMAGGPAVVPVVPAGSVADIAVADLDGDGDDDVVVVDATAPTPLLLLSDGTGAFVVTEAPMSPGPSSAVAAGDLDGDQAIDLVFGDADGNLRAYLAAP